MCCGGCSSGGGELIESLSLFLHHGDIAKRAFVARGGLDSLHILISKAINTSNAANSAGPGPGSFASLEEDTWDGGEASQGNEVSGDLIMQSGHALLAM